MYSTRRRLVLPHVAYAVNEGSALTVPYASVDPRTLTAVELDSLRWRYDNLTAGTQIQDWTTVSTPEQRGTITIPADLNKIENSTCYDRQLNQLTIEMTGVDGNVYTTLFAVEVAAVYQPST